MHVLYATLGKKPRMHIMIQDLLCVVLFPHVQGGTHFVQSSLAVVCILTQAYSYYTTTLHGCEELRRLY